MDRRDLLKYFAIGTTIAPIANGEPIMKAQADLIEVPKVQPVQVISSLHDVLPGSMDCMMARQLAHVTWTNEKGKKVQVDGYLTGFAWHTDPTEATRVTLTIKCITT